MATRASGKLRYEDYCRLPDDSRWELIGGEAFMVPAPSTNHQDLVGKLYVLIANHLAVAGGGRVLMAPYDVILGAGDVVQPDIVFVADSRAEVVLPKHIRGAPTWTVEVVSDPVRDKKVKRDLYLGSGVLEYWTVDAELRCAEIHRPGAPLERFEPPATVRPASLPSLAVDLEHLFADLPPRPRVI